MDHASACLSQTVTLRQWAMATSTGGRVALCQRKQSSYMTCPRVSQMGSVGDGMISAGTEFPIYVGDLKQEEEWHEFRAECQFSQAVSCTEQYKRQIFCGSPTPYGFMSIRQLRHMDLIGPKKVYPFLICLVCGAPLLVSSYSIHSSSLMVEESQHCTQCFPSPSPISRRSHALGKQ